MELFFCFLAFIPLRDLAGKKQRRTIATQKWDYRYLHVKKKENTREGNCHEMLVSIDIYYRAA